MAVGKLVSFLWVLSKVRFTSSN